METSTEVKLTIESIESTFNKIESSIQNLSEGVRGFLNSYANYIQIEHGHRFKMVSPPNSKEIFAGEIQSLISTLDKEPLSDQGKKLRKFLGTRAELFELVDKLSTTSHIKAAIIVEAVMNKRIGNGRGPNSSLPAIFNTVLGKKLGGIPVTKSTYIPCGFCTHKVKTTYDYTLKLKEATCESCEVDYAALYANIDYRDLLKGANFRYILLGLKKDTINKNWLSSILELPDYSAIRSELEMLPEHKNNLINKAINESDHNEKQKTTNFNAITVKISSIPIDEIITNTVIVDSLSEKQIKEVYNVLYLYFQEFKNKKSGVIKSQLECFLTSKVKSTLSNMVLRRVFSFVFEKLLEFNVLRTVSISGSIFELINRIDSLIQKGEDIVKYYGVIGCNHSSPDYCKLSRHDPSKSVIYLDGNALKNIRFTLNHRELLRKTHQDTSHINYGFLHILFVSENSKGYADVCATLRYNGINPDGANHIKLNAYNKDGFLFALNGHRFTSNDLLLICRGGGDLSHPSFNAFHSRNSLEALRELKRIGVTTISGVGHAGDSFPIDEEVDFAQITPTSAANKAISLIKRNNLQLIESTKVVFRK